jgi:Spy/CpxP family protein refolding chaperone
MKKISLLVGMFAGGLLLGVVMVAAQQPQSRPRQGPPPPGQQPRPPMDPLADVMFPPDMIMQHARELELTQEQKNFMRSEMQKTTSRFIELQWQLQDATEALHDTMKANPVNEQQALAQLDKVLDAEREIKRLHIGLGIRLKNQLTAEQQEKLQAMRHSMKGPRPAGPGGPPPGEPGQRPPDSPSQPGR